MALLGACTGNPDVVIDVTTEPGVTVEVYSCPSGVQVNDANCHGHIMTPNEHSVGVFTDKPVLSVAWLVTAGGGNYCQQVELELVNGSIDLDYLAAATKSDAKVTRCEPRLACLQAAVCK